MPFERRRFSAKALATKDQIEAMKCALARLHLHEVFVGIHATMSLCQAWDDMKGLSNQKGITNQNAKGLYCIVVEKSIMGAKTFRVLNTMNSDQGRHIDIYPLSRPQ
jgi:hypothetical protein